MSQFDQTFVDTLVRAGIPPAEAEVLVDGLFTADQKRYFTSNGDLAGVTYDGSNRAVAWSIDDVAYTAAYSNTAIVVAGSDGTIRTMILDAAGRFVGSTTG